METFTPKRVTRSYCQSIAALPEKVFPLLCPEREREWADGWDFRMIHSSSGFAEKGCIFETGSGDDKTVWVITTHDPSAFVIEFVRFTRDSRIVELRVTLLPSGDGGTFAYLNYTYTGLTEKGNEWIDKLSDAEFVEGMKVWEAEINHFIRTGKLLRGTH